MAKVSICIPVYKDVFGVKRLLESIRTQTYKDYEIIITDDTPDDSVKKIVEEYTDLPISYYEGTHLGACENWNKSLDLASGEYIKMIHQDDWLTFPTSLEEYVSLLDNNPNAIMAFSGSRQVTIKESDPLDISEYFDRAILNDNLIAMKKDYRDLYNGDWIGAPSAIIYRNCDVRFDPNLTWIIDVDFYIGLLNLGKDFICTQDALISIGVSDTQMTNRCIDDGDLNIREYSHVMKKYELNKFEAYRNRICYIAAYYNKPYSSIKKLGIPKEEYIVERNKRRAYLIDFYKKLIVRKLTGHE